MKHFDNRLSSIGEMINQSRTRSFGRAVEPLNQFSDGELLGELHRRGVLRHVESTYKVQSAVWGEYRHDQGFVAHIKTDMVKRAAAGMLDAGYFEFEMPGSRTSGYWAEAKSELWIATAENLK